MQVANYIIECLFRIDTDECSTLLCLIVSHLYVHTITKKHAHSEINLHVPGIFYSMQLLLLLQAVLQEPQTGMMDQVSVVVSCLL